MPGFMYVDGPPPIELCMFDSGHLIPDSLLKFLFSVDVAIFFQAREREQSGTRDIGHDTAVGHRN